MPAILFIDKANMPVYRKLCCTSLLALLVSASLVHAEPATEIRADALLQKIESGQAPVILETRSSFEYRRGHIPGALHFPFWLSYVRADDLAIKKDQPVVVYCAHGPRAIVARHALNRHGFTNVKLLKGHMTGWKKAGLPEE